MKIVCDNCGAKYSIADEKVRGKVFKIRCKKCQNIIVVRGTELEGEASAPADDGYAEQPDGTGEYQETPVWHVVIDREQVGPMTVGEVADRFAKGEVTEDNYIWKEGFADWRRLGSVEEFNELTEATKVAPASSVAAGIGAAGGGLDEPPAPWDADDGVAAPAWDAGGGFEAPQGDTAPPWDQQPPAAGAAAPDFGDQGGDQHRDLFATYHGDETENEGLGAMLDAARASAALSSSAVSESAPDAGGAEDAAGDDGGSLFPPTESSAAPQVDEAGGMTGARNENSVLFSLSNLQDLAMGKKSAPAPVVDGGEGSGLIDIRSMAGSAGGGGLSMAPADETPFAGISTGLAGLGGPVAAAPVLMPAAIDEKPNWILPLVVGLGVALLGMGGMVLFLALRTPPAPTLVAQAPVAAQDKAGTPGVAPAAAGGAAVKENSAAGEAGKAAETKAAEPKAAESKAAPAAAANKPKAVAGKRPAARKPAALDEPGALDEPPPSRPRPRRTRRPAAKPGKRDALDDLIDGALDGEKKKPRKRRPTRAAAPAPAASKSMPETLTRAQIQGGMRRVINKVRGCFDRYKVPGLASVKVKIIGAGRVSTAQVKGVFAGTPTGACVSAAAKAARFPKFSGASISITYPFILK